MDFLELKKGGENEFFLGRALGEQEREDKIWLVDVDKKKGKNKKRGVDCFSVKRKRLSRGTKREGKEPSIWFR